MQNVLFLQYLESTPSLIRHHFFTLDVNCDWVIIIESRISQCQSSITMPLELTSTPSEDSFLKIYQCATYFRLTSGFFGNLVKHDISCLIYYFPLSADFLPWLRCATYFQFSSRRWWNVVKDTLSRVRCIISNLVFFILTNPLYEFYLFSSYRYSNAHHMTYISVHSRKVQTRHWAKWLSHLRQVCIFLHRQPQSLQLAGTFLKCKNSPVIRIYSCGNYYLKLTIFSPLCRGAIISKRMPELFLIFCTLRSLAV